MAIPMRSVGFVGVQKQWGIKELVIMLVGDKSDAQFSTPYDAHFSTSPVPNSRPLSCPEVDPLLPIIRPPSQVDTASTVPDVFLNDFQTPIRNE